MQSKRGFHRAPRARSGWVKFGIVVGLVGVIVVGAAGYLLSTVDAQLKPPRLIGSVWSAAADGATRIYYVTKEDRAQTRSFDSDGAYTYQHSYSIYRLCARNGRDGSLAAEAQIARIETTSPDYAKYRAYVTLPEGPGILGPQGDVLWLWNGGLEARSLRTLETVWSDAALRQKNPETAANLPDDPKYVKVMAGLDALVYKARDARYMRVNRESGLFEPVDEGALAALSREHTKTADTGFSSARVPSRSLRSTSAADFVWNSLLDHGVWYALLTADQRAGLKPWLGWVEEWYYRGSNIHESPALLYRGTYTLEPERNFVKTSIDLKVESVAPLSEERFLMAGFLRRPGTDDGWVLPARTWDPAASAAIGAPEIESFIVLRREAIGDKAAWQLSRVGVDGKTAWTRSTRLTDIDHLNDGGGAVVMTGYAAGDSNLKGERPVRMAFVDELSGRTGMLNVATGELEMVE